MALDAPAGLRVTWIVGARGCPVVRTSSTLRTGTHAGTVSCPTAEKRLLPTADEVSKAVIVLEVASV